jgi:hypothetical protein
MEPKLTAGARRNPDGQCTPTIQDSAWILVAPLDHSLPDQRRAARPNGLDPDPELGGDIA